MGMPKAERGKEFLSNLYSVLGVKKSLFRAGKVIQTSAQLRRKPPVSVPSQRCQGSHVTSVDVAIGCLRQELAHSDEAAASGVLLHCRHAL